MSHYPKDVPVATIWVVFEAARAATTPESLIVGVGIKLVWAQETVGQTCVLGTVGVSWSFHICTDTTLPSAHDQVFVSGVNWGHIFGMSLSQSDTKN